MRISELTSEMLLMAIMHENRGVWPDKLELFLARNSTDTKVKSMRHEVCAQVPKATTDAHDSGNNAREYLCF
jgi:hypothetical protein